MNLKLIVVIIVIILLIVISVWYFYSNIMPQSEPKSNVQTIQNNNIQPTANNATDTTTNILNDLNQIPDDSSLNNEADYLNKDIQDF